LPGFPDPCGAEFEASIAAGANPHRVVPDHYVVVKGGTKPLPTDGAVFSGTVGPTLEAAACAVPHGQIRISTVGEIRANGGVVLWEPEISRYDTMNYQHLDIIKAGPTTFTVLQPNTVPRLERIDGAKKDIP